MENRDHLIGMLKQIADGIVNTFQRNCEVAVHDLAQPQKSIVHIAGNVTNREMGAPITELVTQAIHQEGDEIRDRHNYKTLTRDGRVLKSTTLFIRDQQGKPFSAICINFDTTDYLNASQALEAFIKTSDFQGNDRSDSFTSTIEETIDALFQQAVDEIGRQPKTMTRDEKIYLIRQMETKGAFQIKGAVEHVALLLGVSKYTIYNYLKEVHTNLTLKTL